MHENTREEYNTWCMGVIWKIQHILADAKIQCPT